MNSKMEMDDAEPHMHRSYGCYTKPCHVQLGKFLFLESIISRGPQSSNHIKRKLKERVQKRKVDQMMADQFMTGRLYASIGSRPGQCGRCDGYILEGKELEFYVKKMQKKKSKAA